MTVEQLIYTDVPRGRGLDPSLAGFQVKACSAGLDAATRELVGAVCRHYGDAVYRGASDEALDRESAWRATADAVATLPAEILELFPEVWSYDDVGDGRVALTHVRYAGAAHDGRFGNFLAHALVFCPDDLAGRNPLSLARSDLFAAGESVEGTELPALDDLGAPRPAPTPPALLAEPFRDRLEELVDAACRASSFARPLLVRVADWRSGAPLVEALVDALPPGRRRRTTFCTLENDRKWLPPAGPRSRAAGAVAAHDVVVLAGRAGNVRADEVRSTYAVFDFVAGRFGAAEPGAYALFAGRCLRSGRGEDLARNHAALASLLLDGEPEAWDALVGVEEAIGGDGDAAAVGRAARALAGVAREATAASAALDAIVPRLRAGGRRHDDVEAAAPSLAVLAERAGAGDDRAWLDALRAWAADAVGSGEGRIAEALFRACGPARDAALADALPGRAGAVVALPDLPAPEARERLSPDERAALAEALRDREALARLFSDGAAAALAAGDTDRFEQFLETALAAARSAGALDEAWAGAARPQLERYFEGAWDARRAAFAERLAPLVAPDACAAGATWLNETILERDRPTGRALVDALARLARAASDRRAEESVLRRARASFAGAELCDALGRVASASPADALFEAYVEEMSALGEDDCRRVRRSLVDSGAPSAPVREMLAAVVPWDPGAFEAWWLALADPSAAARDELSRQLARALGASDAALACALEVARRTAADSGDGRAGLLDAVALAIPMRPLSGEVAALFAGARDGRGEEAARRLATADLLAEVAELSRDPRWSAGRFLAHFGSEEWPQTIRALRREDKQAVLAFVRETFEAQGIQTPEDAECFVLFMNAAGEATVGEIAASAIRMLDGRDQVTCVVAAAAFARCALGASSVEGAWGEILKVLVDAFDRETRRAFERHIWLRFRRADGDEDARLEALAREAGFTPPSEMGSPSRAGVALKPPSQKKEATTTLFGNSKRFFGRK